MASYKGAEIARHSLREIGVLDPTEDGSDELIADALVVGTDLIDEWRNSKRTISGVTRSVYSLVSGTQSYSIGSVGTFNQDWPESIPYWSRIPDDTATDPVEQPMGRPLSYDQWQQVRVKSDDSSYPSKMYYDRKYDAGLGNCLFHPIPDNNKVDVVLYAFIPAITSLVSATTYDLRPGVKMALTLSLAVELLEGRFKRQGDWSGLYRRAARALAGWKRNTAIPKEAPIRSDFAIGTRGRGINIYTLGR